MRHRRLALLLVACASAAALLATQRNTPRTAIGSGPQNRVVSQLDTTRSPITFRIDPETRALTAGYPQHLADPEHPANPQTPTTGPAPKDDNHPATTQPQIQSQIDFNPFKFNPELVESLRQQQDFFDIPLALANPMPLPAPKTPRVWRFRLRPVTLN
jgi:hypothetical protein